MKRGLWNLNTLQLEGNGKHDSHLVEQGSLFLSIPQLFCSTPAHQLYVKVSFYLYAGPWAGAVEVQTPADLAVGTAASGGGGSK